MRLINNNGRVKIIRDGEELGVVRYRLRRGNTTLEAVQILVEPGNTVAVTFAGAQLKDEFVTGKDFLIVKRLWTVSAPGRYQLLFDYRPSPDLGSWVVPAVMYYGNEVGAGSFPRGGVEKGWAFREDRIPIPSCSILHDGSHWQAVFTNPSNKENEISSVKTYIDQGKPAFEISVPYIEEPFTYTEKGIVTGGLTAKTAAFFEIKKAPFKYTRDFFIAYGRCSHVSEIFITLTALAYGLFNAPPTDVVNTDWSKIASLKFRHLKYLLIDKPAITAIQQGRGNGLFQPFHNYTAGSFLTKSMEASVIFTRAAGELGNDKYRAIAERIGDFFLAGSLPNGLHQDSYSLKDGRWGGYMGVGTPLELVKGANTRCNGEVMLNYLRLFRLLKDAGIRKDEFIKLAARNAGFYISHQLKGSEEGSFGRWWDTDGRPLNTLGTNGAYIISVLIELEKVRGKTDDIDMALKKAGRYYASLVDNNSYYADTLDADCVDKEAGCALLRAFLGLYERDHDEYYLRYARLAAGFVLSWMFTYNVIFNLKSPLGRRDFKTLGMTTVSVAHHHLDFYGLFIAYDFLRLWQATGDELWKKCARAMIASCSQLISTRDDLLGRGADFIGWQPEQLNQTNWDYKLRFLGTKGRFHSCVAWPVVLTLGAMLDIRERFPDMLDFKLSE